MNRNTHLKILHTVLFIADCHHEIKDIGEFVEMEMFTIRSFGEFFIKWC